MQLKEQPSRAAPADHIVIKPKRAGWWKPALIGFAVGLAVSQALGIWSFASHLVHGVPVSGFNGAAKIAQTFDPQGWKRVEATWEDDRTGPGGRLCVSLTLPKTGIAAGKESCSKDIAGLRVRSGQAPKGPRLALAQPLFATEKNRPAKAPVAGWAAQVGTQTATTATADAGSDDAAGTAQPNDWATSTFSQSN